MVPLRINAYAVQVAGLLRAHGVSVELDVKHRGVKGNLHHANRMNIPTVVIVGSQERSTGTAVVRDMAAHSERRLTLNELEASGIEITSPRHPPPDTRARDG